MQPKSHQVTPSTADNPKGNRAIPLEDKEHPEHREPARQPDPPKPEPKAGKKE